MGNMKLRFEIEILSVLGILSFLRNLGIGFAKMPIILAHLVKLMGLNEA